MSSTNRGAKRREADFYPTPASHVHALIRWLVEDSIRTTDGRLILDPDRDPRRMVVVDPSAGDGAILRGFEPLGVRLAAVELREECRSQLVGLCGAANVHIGDALQAPDRDFLSADLVLFAQNPAFSLMRKFISRYSVNRISAALLPSSYYRGHTGGKPEWWQGKEPVRELKLPKRPSFVDVCKGFGRTKFRHRIKGCGELFPSGTGGRCPNCGGSVSAGTDSADYIWALWGVKPGLRPNRVAPLRWFA